MMRLLLLLSLCIFLKSALANSSLTLNSEADDPLGNGQSYEYDAVAVDYFHSENLSLSAGNFRFEFSKPDSDEVLTSKAYLNAKRWSDNTHGSMGIENTPNNTYCFDGTGEFYIYEIEAPDKLALDFTYYCNPSDDTAADNNALHGSIRINSDLPVPYTAPTAVIEGPKQHKENTEITLNGNSSFSRHPRIDHYAWQQISGPTATISTPDQAVTTVQLPDNIKLGGEPLEFQLTVTDSGNNKHSATHSLNVTSKSDAYTYLQMSSSNGDYIGQGKDWLYNTGNATFEIDNNYNNGVNISIQSGNYISWNTNFAAPDNEPLQTGTYGLAERLPFQSAGSAGLSVSGDGRGCNRLNGAFVVNKLERNESGDAQSFLATFDQYCEGGSAVLSGTIAYRVTDENVPTANAGNPIEVNEQGIVNLNGSDSFDTIGNIQTYAWSNTTDNLRINNANQSRAYFTAPTLNDREASRLIPLRLLVTDDEGYQSEDWVNVKVLSTNTAPNATDDAFSAPVGSTSNFTLLDNDNDGDGSITIDSINIIDYPTQGIAIINSDGTISYTPSLTTAGTDSFTYTIKDNDGAVSNTATATIQITVADNTDTDPKLSIRAFLQGAYDPASGLMHDNLRTGAFLPMQQPYRDSVFAYDGNEALPLPSAAISGETAAVDWVLIELRHKNNINTVMWQQAALIQRNGYLFDFIPGNNELILSDLVPDLYYVALHHRNHLSIITANPVFLSKDATLLDFTTPTTAITQPAARYENNDIALIWSGDINRDLRINSNGPDNDSIVLLSTVLTDPQNSDYFNTNFISYGYYNSDLNMDGKTIFTGPGNDTSLMLQNVFLHPGNTNMAGNYSINGATE